MFVADVLSAAAHESCAPPTALVRDVLSIMAKGGSGVVFFTVRDCLVGLVTDGDIRRGLEKWPNLMDLPAEQIMTRSPLRVGRDTPVVEAYRIFQKHGINALPITDGDGRFQGFITFHDVARTMSPERIYPNSVDDREDESIAKHIARYELADRFIPPGATVLDCACGVGYGSSILGVRAGKVIGVDISEEAIAFAKRSYSRPNIEYIEKDIAFLDFAPETFDVIVSFETLEHVPKTICETFLDGVSRWLRPGGILVSSSPMLRFRDGLPYVTNPHHINEMPKKELLEMCATRLNGFILHYYHQNGIVFTPLAGEDTGFCVIVARKGLQ